VITIASALMPDGCDVIASLLQIPPPVTRNDSLASDASPTANR